MTIPRITWINLNWTLREVHHQIFNFLKGVISIWYDLSKTDDARSKGIINPPFKTSSIDENEEETLLTKDAFMRLTLQDQFKAAFSSLTEDNWQEILKKDEFNTSDLLYSLRIKNIAGYNQDCPFCKDRRCDGCPLPYTDKLTYKELLKNADIESNDSFFSEEY